MDSVMLHIPLPADLLDEETPQPMLEALAREALVVRLYALGQIGSGKGAKILGISRRAFLALLDQYGVSWFDDTVSFSELPKQD
jgi:predicted HTH domain antitoxin